MISLSCEARCAVGGLCLAADAGRAPAPQGVVALAAALRNHSSLESLELGYNPLGPDGTKALLDLVKFQLPKVGQAGRDGWRPQGARLAGAPETGVLRWGGLVWTQRRVLSRGLAAPGLRCRSASEASTAAGGGWRGRCLRARGGWQVAACSHPLALPLCCAVRARSCTRSSWAGARWRAARARARCQTCCCSTPASPTLTCAATAWAMTVPFCCPEACGCGRAERCA